MRQDMDNGYSDPESGKYSLMSKKTVLFRLAVLYSRCSQLMCCYCGCIRLAHTGSFGIWALGHYPFGWFFAWQCRVSQMSLSKTSNSFCDVEKGSVPIVVGWNTRALVPIMSLRWANVLFA